jgi:predicted DNA-binding transcriptional regulator AlpA
MARAPDRPPSYLSTASLARELDVSETTVGEMVKRGVLPKPVKLSSGCVRWSWADVEAALESLKDCVEPSDADPYMKGAKHVAQAGD